MKKLLIISLFTFILVGCGSKTSSELKCHLENGDEKRNLTITFKDDNKEVDDAIMEFSYTPSDIANARKIISEDCEKKEFKKCEIKEDGNRLTYEVGGNPKALGINTSKSLEETKEILEKDGYTCNSND